MSAKFRVLVMGDQDRIYSKNASNVLRSEESSGHNSSHLLSLRDCNNFHRHIPFGNADTNNIEGQIDKNIYPGVKF